MSDIAAGPSTAAPSTSAPTTSTASSTGPSATPASATTAPAPGQNTTPAQKAEIARRKYALKVDGTARELELSDDEVAVRLQKAEAAEKRMAEAAQIRKQFQGFQEKLKQDPWAAAEMLGMSREEMKAFAEKRLYEEYSAEEMQKKSPQEYELMQARKQIEDFQRREQEAKLTQTQKAQQEHAAKVEAQLTQTFVETLESAGLPKNRRTVQMMAEVMRGAVEHGIELSPQHLAAEVNERIRADAAHVLKDMRGDQLTNYLGKEVVDEILRHSIKKARGIQNQPVAAPTSGAHPLDDPQTHGQKTLADIRREKMDRRPEAFKSWRATLRGE